MSVILFLIAGYLLGSIPTSYLAGRKRGLDLRQHGSGNLGATNTVRVLGWRMGSVVLAADVLKGWFPAFFFINWDGQPYGELAAAYGAAAILGHVYPVFVGFRGGKGVATGAGVFLALAPVALGVVLAIWALAVWLTRIVSLASLIAAVAAPLVVLVALGIGAPFWLALGLMLLVINAHRTNIRRVFSGQEPRLKRNAEELCRTIE